ncbi:unnamed protein product [Rotaria sordida]|uniref:Poly [ADP-ribose] polymerase n=1 Tax=Rotaria sordida TaxID=392033 RepID=A0A815GXF9_9BILA|nr:unnamed protein product [Rotaria sordida]CAF1346292.1 unnamed protein product [Rotaria sordida]
MATLVFYPQITYFRQAITDSKHYVCLSSDGYNKQLPILNFIGTVKLHGTNAAIGYLKGFGYWCQSRNCVITPDKDHAGFTEQIFPFADEFFNVYVLPHCPTIREHYQRGDRIVIFGEWCGGNIQKNVALCGLPTMFVIFKVRIVNQLTKKRTNANINNEEQQETHSRTFWLDPKEWANIKWHEHSIYNIYDFPTYTIEINFNQPKLSQDALTKITEEVERQCPVGAYFNRVGIGEGVVWTEWTNTGGDLTFKVLNNTNQAGAGNVAGGDALHRYGIMATPWRQDWRYVLLIDENTKTGPFTMDLIEPHIALAHDRIDFDVSDLSLERGYTKDLGMRVDITGGSYSIQLETIVENIRNKNFQVLRPVDGENGPNTSGTVAERIEKMKSRGWTQIGTPFSFIPDPPSTYNAVLVPYPSTTLLYQNLVTEMKKIPQAQVISIEQIKNPNIEALERELFHGTSGEAIQGIIDRGFDDRYFSPSGAWRRGAYFADDPRKSNLFARPDPTTQRRVIFYNKVLLGVESVQTQPNNSISVAPLNHHSVHGTGFQYHEYIVYRYGQALPYLKITYTAP